MGQLDGKVAVVIGAAGQGNMGQVIARTFAREGAMPIIVSRSAESLAKAVASIQQATGVTAQTVAADLGTQAGIDTLMSGAGVMDILVNNAGAIPGGALAAVDDAKWRAAWELKLFGYINLIRAVLPQMELRGSGVIANIIGMAGQAPRADYICGAAGNAALIAFTRALGGASPEHGVRVTGINPAATRTDRIVTLSKNRAQQKFGDESRWEEMLADLPFGRPAEPEEIAWLSVFLASRRGAYLSGTVVDVDGGNLFRK